MRISKIIFMILFVSVFSLKVSAQQQEMTLEQWTKEMEKLRTEKEQLVKERDGLKSDNTMMKDQLKKMPTYDQAMTELYQLVGATKQDVDNYKAKVNEIAGKINNCTPKKADRQIELNELKANKISALPEFFETVQNQLQRAVDACKDPEEKVEEQEYSVVRGDCLWNIAKKKTVYSNAFAWPKIYDSNRDQIKNPDLIYPKQGFKIPALTEDEKGRYDKLKRNYKPAPAPQN